MSKYMCTKCGKEIKRIVFMDCDKCDPNPKDIRLRQLVAKVEYLEMELERVNNIIKASGKENFQVYG